MSCVDIESEFCITGPIPAEDGIGVGPSITWDAKEEEWEQEPRDFKPSSKLILGCATSTYPYRLPDILLFDDVGELSEFAQQIFEQQQQYERYAARRELAENPKSIFDGNLLYAARLNPDSGDKMRNRIMTHINDVRHEFGLEAMSSDEVLEILPSKST